MRWATSQLKLNIMWSKVHASEWLLSPWIIAVTPQAHYYHFSRSWKFLLVASVTWERLVSSTLNTTGHFLLQGCLEVGPPKSSLSQNFPDSFAQCCVWSFTHINWCNILPATFWSSWSANACHTTVGYMPNPTVSTLACGKHSEQTRKRVVSYLDTCLTSSEETLIHALLP